MLKRSGASVLTLLYLVTVMGFALNMHFCGSYLVSVKINAPAKSCTPLVGKMKCCHNKHFEIKIKDAHQGQRQTLQAKAFAFQLPAFHFADFLLNTQYSLSPESFAKAPPDPPSCNINSFLKNCTFRI